MHEACGPGDGTYDKTVVLTNPFTDRLVNIDPCIVPTIQELWALDIWTIESCCGHGRRNGYIAVTKISERKMEALGYQRDPRAPHVFLWPKHEPHFDQ